MSQKVIVVAMVLLGVSAARADLLGSSVNASLTSGGFSVGTQWVSPQTVIDPGTEFTGTVFFHGSPFAGFEADLDIDADSFSLTFIRTGFLVSVSDSGLLGFTLSLPGFVTGVTASAANPSGVESLNFAGGVATVTFDQVVDAETFEFDVQQPAAVPEPGSILLLLSVITACGFIAAKRVKRA